MSTRRRAWYAATGLWVAVFVACIVLANWSLVHIGIDNGAGQPRIIPVGFGLYAPSGVVFAGALLTVRDVIHDRIGLTGTMAVILGSAPVTAVTSTPSLAIASVVTFVIAEIADLVVYTRVRRHGRVAAVLASNTVSSLIDSFVFLTIAFGLTAAARGTVTMTIGKLGASVATLALVAAVAALSRTRALTASREGRGFRWRGEGMPAPRTQGPLASR